MGSSSSRERERHRTPVCQHGRVWHPHLGLQKTPVTPSKETQDGRQPPQGLGVVCRHSVEDAPHILPRIHPHAVEIRQLRHRRLVTAPSIAHQSHPPAGDHAPQLCVKCDNVAAESQSVLMMINLNISIYTRKASGSLSQTACSTHRGSSHFMRSTGGPPGRLYCQSDAFSPK
jgi:hypothetical protein